MKLRNIVSLAAITVALAGCASQDTSVGKFRVGKPYNIAGKTYYPEENYTKEQTGIASWYGPGFDGNKTANGERFDEDALTAAHPTLQMPSLVRVTNLENGQSLVVRVNDRGPFHSNRIIDLSKGAAKSLGVIATGTARVRLQVLGPESIALASAAKQGIDTRGAEIAMNDTGQLDERFASFYPSYVAAPQPDVMVAASGYQPGLPAGAQVVTADTLAVPQIEPALTSPQIVLADGPAASVAPVAAAPLADTVIPVAQVTQDTHVQKLPKAHKAAIFQMSPIPEANAAEASVPAAPKLALEIPQANYLPTQPKFLGMKPVIERPVSR